MNEEVWAERTKLVVFYFLMLMPEDTQAMRVRCDL